jgi:hypothetical protein
MKVGSGSLDRWRTEFLERDWCPWPGPRPLREHEHHLLVGRSDDRDRFGQLLNEENKRLILLHGPSGAGKSSLLDAGLRRDLKTRGATIRGESRWGGYKGEGAREFLARKLGLTGREPFEAFGRLEAGGVLILDQFEELVRYSPRITRQLFREILEVNRLYKTKVIISFRSEYLHEFEELETGAVNFSVGTMPVNEIEPRFALAVVKSGNRRKLVETAADAVDDEVASWIADQWTTARERLVEQVRVIGDDPFARVGLLHLQALLYTLYFASQRSPLTSDSIEGALEEWRAQSTDSLQFESSAERWQDRWAMAPQGFRSALSLAVNYKLEHCGEAGRDGDLVDSQLRRGTRWMVERTVKHLSSAGYKLIRSAPELASFALGSEHEHLERELRRRGVTHAHESELLAELLRIGLVGDSRREAEESSIDVAGIVDQSTDASGEQDESTDGPLDLIDSTRHDIARHVDRRGSAVWGELLAKPGSKPFENDPNEVTSGFLFGHAPADVAIEEFRRFVFALTWLEESDLVRVATPLEGQPMVSLIHDGFGTALNRWADAAKDDPEGRLSALTAPRGFSFEWPNRREGLLAARGADSASDRVRRDATWTGRHRVLTNLRWQNGTVQNTRLERIAFLNCDFQGLQFRECDFQGVLFVNCLLDGSVFSDCTFMGPLPGLAVDDEWSPDDPSFIVPTNDDVLPLFRRYMRDGEDLAGLKSESLFCDLPGEPAVPLIEGDETPHEASRIYRIIRGEEEHLGRLRVDLVDGGVAIFGGRVSHLIVRRCTFARESGLAIRHATGSGLDLVEVLQEAEDIGPSHLEIFGSAVRHLNISTLSGVTGSVDLSVVGSMLVQMYIGTDLSGVVEAEGSSLLHVWNASPLVDSTLGVAFNARNCAVHGTIDIAPDDDSIEVGVGPQVEQARDIRLRGQPLPVRLARMDYRRNPAQLRHAQRVKSSEEIEGD